ncbi:MAG: GntR family transcriptional regulator [Armatimonadota bacterium]|nr:GntR family transcriptional regulator [bacterium]
MGGGSSKYTALRDKLRKDILSGRYKPGDRLPSETELRAEWQLSNNTVREAILSLIHEGLATRTQGKGTFVSQIKSVRKTLAVVIPRIAPAYIHDDFDVMPTYVSALEAEAHDLGWDLLLQIYNSDRELEKVKLSNSVERGVDGVISFFSGNKENVDCLFEIKNAGIPLVMVDSYYEGIGIDYISTDNYTGSYKATMMLAEAGFDRICYLNSKDRDNSTVDPIASRLRGYQDAMTELGKFPHLLYPPHESENWDEAGYKMASEMLNYIQRPFALFAMMPPLASGAMRAISEAHVPPESVAFACFDDIRTRLYENMLLISIIQPLEEIARKAVRMINDKFMGDTEQHHDHIEPEVVVLNNSPRECHV